MIKKILSVLLCLVLCLSVFSACSNGPEEGTIEDVEIEKAPPGEEASGMFTKLASPYDYDYKTFAWKKAHIAMDIPSTWDVVFVNSRYIQIQVPESDTFIPGASMAFLANYGDYVNDDAMSEYTLNDHAYMFSSLFKNELEGIPYFIGNRKCHLRSYTSEDEIRNGLDFVSKEHAKDAATLTASRVFLVDKTGKYFTDHGMVTTYFKWDQTPFCFSAIAPEDELVSVREMLEYIVSSICYCKSIPAGYEEVSYEDFKTKVPASFKPAEEAENIFVSDPLENTETAGMSVGVFRLEQPVDDPVSGIKAEPLGEFSMTDITENYGQTIAEFTFGPYAKNPIYDFYSDDAEESKEKITCNLGVNCTGYEYATEIAGSPFGQYANYKGDFYPVEKNGTRYLVVVFYQGTQKDVATAAGKTAVRNLQVR